MATYNKPGVYVEESLTPNLPVAVTTAPSVAAFIGVADRGPTEVVSSNVLAVPTLVSSWTEFTNLFSYGSSINTFSGIGVGTAANDLKYAVKTFFDNGGSQAYIAREVNTDAVKASVSFRDSNSSVAQAVSWSLDGTTNQGAKKLTITATSGTPFVGMEAGRLVNFSGITATAYTFLNSSTWVVAEVAGTNDAFSITWKSDTPITLATQASGITVSGGARSTTPTLVVTAKDHGAWAGNASDNRGIWVGIEPNQQENYFDLNVYYSTTATTSSDLTDANRVERFSQLSMSSTNSRYVLSVIGSGSNWVTVADSGSAATGKNDLPAFTGYWATADGSANINTTNGSFTWNTGSFSTSTLKAAKLGVTASTSSTVNGVAGANGSTAPVLATQVLARFDAVTTPLIMNYPAKTTTATINALLTYAKNRNDSFVIIDAVNDTVANALSTTSNVGIGSYSGDLNYGAAYYPYLVIPDPASTTGATKTVAPGGAVAAVYVSTDSARGVFKAPAGSGALIRSAVAVPALTNDEFNLVAGSSTNLNVIRFVPGSGICVMGARTISSTYSDRYVPIRRTLNYLSNTLKNSTQYAVFEPNDQNLWRSVEGTLSGILNEFWRRGGLAGGTAEQAFYVKCDADLNTPSVVSSGELRIEVGVALQRPAEFVIIKIGQIDGGSTVTTSV